MKNTERQEAALRARIKQERKNAAGSRVRYSDQLRAAVVGFATDSGLSRAQVARALSLSETVVSKWLQKSAASTPRLDHVRIVADDASPERQGLVLEFPNGARLVGLSLDDVSSLLGSGA